jgi:hypothetical protein
MSLEPSMSALEPATGLLASAKANSRNLITAIRENPFWGSLAMELTGANLMGVLCVGNMAERIEQCIMQFGNTAQTFIGGLLVDKALDFAYKKTIPNLEEALKTPSGKAWYKFGKSMALFGYITPFMLVLPKMRDIYTLKTTGAITFDEMTGYTQFNRDDPEHKQRENETIHKKWQQIITVIGTGFTGFMALYALAGWAIAKGKDYPKWLENIERAEWQGELFGKKDFRIALPGCLVGETNGNGERSIFLKDGKFSNFTGGYLMTSWLLPGYTGWLLSPRGILGVFEDVVKAGWAVASFSGLKSGVVKKFESAVEGNKFFDKGFDQWFGNKENRSHFSREFVGTVLYAMPVLFSFSTRGIRAKLFGFKGQQHEISAIPIEAYQDEEATTTSGLVTPSPFKKSYLAKAQSSLSTVGVVSNTPSFVRLSMAVASTPEPAIASDEKLTATALERKKRDI